jgi:hypothetical protein
MAACAFFSCGSDNGENTLRSPSVSEANQPVREKEAWQWVAPIDGSGYCGPASIYHIISYYGDWGEYEYKTPSGLWAETPLEIPEITEANPMFIDVTDFGIFIQPDPDMGSGWIDLKKVAKLYRSRNTRDPLYQTYVCSEDTEIEAIETRRARLGYIRDHLLTKGLPVVIHLESSIPFYGHYITLIGHSLDRNEVYYVDSLKHDSGVLSAPADDFLGSWFYSAGLLYTARWDGEWMALWHPDGRTPCDCCGD